MRDLNKAEELFQQLHDEDILNDDLELQTIMKNYIYGDVYQHGILDLRLRELILIVVNTTNHTLTALKEHVNAAIKAEVSPIQIKEVIYQCTPYIGLGKVQEALEVVNLIFKKHNISTKPQATVNEKTRFEKVLSGSIYTSFDFVKKYKTWKNVSVSYNDQKKTIHKWKYDDLAYKMSSKRIVGKIQPEKNKERSKYNFTIDIQGDNYTLKIETMGKDYVKISSDKGEAYYEVSIALYEYLREEIFRLPVDSDDSE